MTEDQVQADISWYAYMCGEAHPDLVQMIMNGR